MNSGWGGEDKCFLSTPAYPCNGPRVEVTKEGASKFIVEGGEVLDEHVRNTADYMREEYTPELARMATEMLRPDLELLGYEEWDGVRDPNWGEKDEAA